MIDYYFFLIILQANCDGKENHWSRDFFRVLYLFYPKENAGWVLCEIAFLPLWKSSGRQNLQTGVENK